MKKTDIVQRLLDKRQISAEEAVVLLNDVQYVPLCQSASPHWYTTSTDSIGTNELIKS